MKWHQHEAGRHSVRCNSKCPEPGQSPRQRSWTGHRLGSTHQVEGGTFAKGNGDSQDQQDPPNVQREKAKGKDCDCYGKLYVGVGVNSGEQ